MVCTHEFAGEVDELLGEEMPILGTRRKVWTEREHAKAECWKSSRESHHCEWEGHP